MRITHKKHLKSDGKGDTYFGFSGTPPKIMGPEKNKEEDKKTTQTLFVNLNARTEKMYRELIEFQKELPKFRFPPIHSQNIEEIHHELYKTTTLNLSDMDLKHIPPIVYRLTGIQTLDLTGNQLTKIPEEISKSFPKLKHLIISGNKLQTLPLHLLELKHLKTISCYGMKGNLKNTWTFSNAGIKIKNELWESSSDEEEDKSNEPFSLWGFISRVLFDKL